MALGSMVIAGCSSTATTQTSASPTSTQPAANSVSSDNARLEVEAAANDAYMYGTLKNSNPTTVNIVGGSAPNTSQVIPEKVNPLDGATSDEAVAGGIPVPGNSEVILESTNYRIQLKGLNPVPTKGSSVVVTLSLSNGTQSQVTAAVQ